MNESAYSAFMANPLEGKAALILGVANNWSLAHAIAQASGARVRRWPSPIKASD